MKVMYSILMVRSFNVCSFFTSNTATMVPLPFYNDIFNIMFSVYYKVSQHR